MMIKELKQNILLSLYHRYKGGKSTNIGLKDLCEHDHILFDSLQQVSDAAEGLKESGYINLTLFMGGDGHISGLTPSGIEYVEENLLSVDDQIIDGLSDTEKMMRSGNNVNINVGQLDNERQIDSLGIVRPDMYYDKDYAQDMLRLIWEPLKENVSEGATVYYVPSQLLFQVSLESLPLSDGSLLGNHYRFVRLSSARELLKMRSGGEDGKANTAVLYGGLQYDLETSAMAEESKKYDLSSLLAMRGEVARGDSIFHYLQGTKDEIENIENVLKQNKWQVTPYMGKNGTEESFLNMHGKSPKLLHLATHGFYYTPNRAENVDYLKGYTDAMSLSGLVFSGGNAAWLGKPLPKGVLGGILSANDIARLDLSNTDMVVLSACQTGQGKATAEGLYGLQRAFKKAGVGTIVMSLWNVSDKTTSEFMTTFYERLADKKNAWNKRKAFEEAKEIIRQKHPDPFHWAAFVMLD